MKIPHEIIEQLEFAIDSNIIEERDLLLQICEKEGLDKEATDLLVANLRMTWVRGVYSALKSPRVVLQQFESVGVKFPDVSA